MKELSTEEKAKAYDEALKWMCDLYPNLGIAAKEKAESIFPELRESKDEKVRKAIIELVKQSSEVLDKQNQSNMLAWLKKQGEHANFRNKIQVGDKVTRNRDGMLVNLSQLNRVAKKDEKQSETYTKKDVDNAFVEGMALAKDELEKQKPVWSEDDEKMLNSIIEDFGDGKTSNMLQEYWLKSIKERIGE